MICHDFEAEPGPAPGVQSGGARGPSASCKRTTVVATVAVDGVHVGEEIPVEDVPSAWDQVDAVSRETGSIIVIVATDAPLLPHQLRRIAQRSSLGIGRVGGAGGNSSGDIMLAFSTANAGRIPNYKAPTTTGPTSVDTLPDEAITSLFWATIEATEEAILNALVAADTMVGHDGITAHALPHERLVEVMTKYGRGRPLTVEAAGSNPRPRAPKARALPAALRPACCIGIVRPGTLLPMRSRSSSRNVVSYALSILL